MKRTAFAATAFSALLLMTGCAVPTFGGADKPAAAAAGVPSIEGTTWVGTDSDGDYYEYTFVRGGQLRFATRSASGAKDSHEEAGDYWAQNGQVVLITTTKFATRQGLISGNRMQGDAWNVRGNRWTWVGDKR
jgi:hypothetical protein